MKYYIQVKRVEIKYGWLEVEAASAKAARRKFWRIQKGETYEPNDIDWVGGDYKNPRILKIEASKEDA